MTREEAIEILKDGQLNRCSSVESEALDMGISALEMQPLIEKFQELDDAEKLARLLAMVQEPICDRDCEHCTWTECPIEPCDDAVSREAVLDGLKGCICDEWVKTLFATMVKQLPSVTPSITNNLEKSNFDKRQYRVDTDTAYQCGYEQGKKDSRRKGHWITENNMVKCSECGRFQRDCRYGHTNYCNHCGAEMESKE